MEEIALVDRLDAQQVPFGAAPREAQVAPRLGEEGRRPERARLGGSLGDGVEHAHPRNSAAAAAVISSCSSVWASEGIAASNCDGASAMPRSSMCAWNAAKRAVSDA